MTLVQQFPDISAAIRLKNEKGSKNSNVVRPLNVTEAEAASKHYKNEFHKWHIKFLFIVAGTLALVYFLILKAFWIYNTVNIR